LGQDVPENHTCPYWGVRHSLKFNDRYLLDFLELACGSKSEVARLLGVGSQSVYDWFDAGRIPLYAWSLLEQFPGAHLPRGYLPTLDEYLESEKAVREAHNLTINRDAQGRYLVAAQVKAGEYLQSEEFRSSRFYFYALAVCKKVLLNEKPN
jgi:hypothetical protein